MLSQLPFHDEYGCNTDRDNHRHTNQSHTLNATAIAVTIIEPVKGYEDNTYTFTYTTGRLFQCGCDRCVGLSLLCIRD